MRFEEPLVKGYAGPHLGSWGSLPIIAIGPRGGQIVGYTGLHDPIYAGSSRGHKLSALRTEADKKTPKKTPAVTQDEILDWLKLLGFKEADLQWVETQDKQNLTVTVSKAAASVIQHHFKVDPVFVAHDYARFDQKDLIPHIGKPLTPTNAAESATFKAKAAAGELDKDPFPPLKDLVQITPGKLAGSHGNLAFKSPDGRKWLFKHASQKSCRAEEAAVRLGRLLMGPGVIQAGRHVTLDGKTGVLLEVIPGSVVSAESHSKFPAEVSQKFFDQVVQHQVVDWLISNHDSHGGNWVVTPDGKLAGVDKGQSWKFLGSDKLNLEYQPNHSRQIYKNFWKQYQDGDIKGDPLKAAEAILAKIDKISDAQFLSIVGPAAHETGQPEQMAKRMLGRLHGMRADVSKFLSGVTGKHVDLIAGPKLVIPAKVPMETPVEKPVSAEQKQANTNLLHSYFEAYTTVGDIVTVRWTNSGIDLTGKGKVVKANAKSWVVELAEPVTANIGGGPVHWEKGQKINVPNGLNDNWGWFNTIMPVMKSGEPVSVVIKAWAESPAGKAAIATIKQKAPAQIAEVAKPVILEKPEAKPPTDVKGAPAGWPLTKGPVTVLLPGTPPEPNVSWPKGYPGPGFAANIKYKGKLYGVKFIFNPGGPSFEMTYPDGQVKTYSSPNAASDSMVLFQKGLPLDTSSTDKKVKHHISYPAAKAFGIQKFQDELAHAHSATASEFKEKFPETKIEDHPIAEKPSEPGESNWEWFDTHKVVHSELTSPHAQWDAAKILQSLPPGTQLSFMKEGYSQPLQYTQAASTNWVGGLGDTLTHHGLAAMIGDLSPETPVYYLAPGTPAGLPKKESESNWEWFDELNVAGKKNTEAKIVSELAPLEPGTIIRYTGASGDIFEYQKTPEYWVQLKGYSPGTKLHTPSLAEDMVGATGGIEIAKPVAGASVPEPIITKIWNEYGIDAPEVAGASVPEPIITPALAPKVDVAELAASTGFAGGVVTPGQVLPPGSKKSFVENFGAATGNVKIDVEITPTGALVWLDTAGKPGPWAEGQQHVAAGFNSLSAAANWLGMLKGGYATTAEFEKAWGKKPAYNPATVFGIKPSVYNQLVSMAEASATPAPEKVVPGATSASQTDKLGIAVLDADVEGTTYTGYMAANAGLGFVAGGYEFKKVGGKWLTRVDTPAGMVDLGAFPANQVALALQNMTGVKAVDGPVESGAPNWEWFDSHKVESNVLQNMHDISAVEHVLEGMPNGTMLEFKREGFEHTSKFVRIGNNWRPTDSELTYSSGMVAGMMTGVEKGTPIYIANPTLAAEGEKGKPETIQKVSFLPITVTPATLEAAPIGQIWEWDVNDPEGTYKLQIMKTVGGYEVGWPQDEKPVMHTTPPNKKGLQDLFADGSNYVTYMLPYAKWVGLMADVDNQKDPAFKNWKWVSNYNFWAPKYNAADALDLVQSLPIGTKLRWEVTDANGDHEWREYERQQDGSWKYDIPNGPTATDSATLLEHWKTSGTSIPMVLLGEGTVPAAPNPLDILLSPPKVETLPIPVPVMVPKPAPKPTTKAKKVKFVQPQALALFNTDMAETWAGGKAAIEQNMKAAQGPNADVGPGFQKSPKWPSWCPPPLSLIEGEYEGKKYVMGVATSGVNYSNLTPTKQAKIYVISGDKVTYAAGHGIANNLKYAAKKHGLPADLKALKQIFGLSNAVFLPGETLESVQKNTGLSAIPMASTDNVKSVALQSPEEQQQVVKTEMTFAQWFETKYPSVTAWYDVEAGPGAPVNITLTLTTENAQKLGIKDPSVYLAGMATGMGLEAGPWGVIASPNGATFKFPSNAIANLMFTDIMTKHQWASSAPVPSDDNWETMPEGYPKVISQLMGVGAIMSWVQQAPKGTKLYIPNTDAVYEVEAAGVTHVATNKFWSAKEWANLFYTTPATKEFTVVPPGVSVAEIKAMKPKIAGVGTQVPKPKPLSAEQQAKLAKAKEIASWAQSHKAIMDPAALHVLSYLQKALPKKSIWARQGDGGQLLLGGKDSTAIQEYLHKHIKTAADVDTPMGVLTAVTVTDLQTHFPESGMTTGPDGKEYPAGTKFETETVKTTVGEMLTTEVSKIAEHKHKAETHNYLKISGTDDAAKLKLQAVLDKFGLKPDGEIKAAEKYTGVGVAKSALAKVHHTTELVKPEVPEGPPAFIAASLPSFGGDQGHRQPAMSNRGDLSILDTLTLPQIGRWIWCGKHGIFDYNQVRAYKVKDHQGKIYYQVSGRLRNPKMNAMTMPATKMSFRAGEYDAKTGIRKEGTSQLYLGQHDARASVLDSGTIVEVVNEPAYRSFHGEFRIRIPEGADVETELGAAFTKMGLNPVEALADPDDHDRQMFIKSSIVRSFMGPAGFHIGQTQWANEAWLDVRLKDLGADKYVATAEVSHDCQGKSVVLIHDEDEVAKNQVGFIYSGRKNRTSLVGRLLDEGLASHQSRFQAGKVGNQESLSSDLSRGGSNVTFCRLGNKKTTSQSWGLNCNHGFNMIYHPRVLQRSDWYAYNSDIFGDSGNNQWPRQDQFGNVAGNNEIDFESGMANGDLAGCVLHDEDDKKAIINTLKGRGILEYNGIPLDKFFMVYKGSSRAYVADQLYGLKPGVLA